MVMPATDGFLNLFNRVFDAQPGCLFTSTGDALFYSGPPRSAEEFAEMLARQGWRVVGVVSHVLFFVNYLYSDILVLCAYLYYIFVYMYLLL